MPDKATVICLAKVAAVKRARSHGERHLTTLPPEPLPMPAPVPFTPILAAMFAAWSIGFAAGAAWTWWWR